MFTFKQLRYFQALTEAGHFGDASERVGISQPALSVQIAEMEKTVGAPLFERTSKRIILTPLGRNFLPLFIDIIERVTALNDVVADNDMPLNYPLKLGIIPTLAPYLLPILLPEMAKSFPALQLQIQETKTDRLADFLRDGDIDVVIAASPFPTDDIMEEHLFQDRFFLAVPKTDPRDTNMHIYESDMDGGKLLLLEEGHCLREQTLQVCKTKLYRHDITASSLATLLQLVSNGIGTTVVPQIAISTENQHGIVKILPFIEPSPTRSIKLFWRKRSHRSNDFRILAKELRQIVQPILDEHKNYMHVI